MRVIFREMEFQVEEFRKIPTKRMGMEDFFLHDGAIFPVRYSKWLSGVPLTLVKGKFTALCYDDKEYVRDVLHGNWSIFDERWTEINYFDGMIVDFVTSGVDSYKATRVVADSPLQDSFYLDNTATIVTTHTTLQLEQL